ncbi:MAG: SDR family NAD(P)-dependent oxidoreductase [Desulfamplus sp.]|nr:SDR family NAD(P)-dependent oxidoreductase [Desulfamplus sp.]
MCSAVKKKCAFVYAGIGTQWKTMGTDLFNEQPIFRDIVERCDKKFAKFSKWSIVEEINRSANDSRIDDLLIAHPCNVAIQIGLSGLLKSWGITPHGVVGHSSGEVAAANIAGILNLDDAMHLVWQHCQLMSYIIGKGVLAHIGLPKEAVREILDSEESVVSSSIWISAINSPAATVVTGAADILTPLIKRLEEKRIFCRILRINIPYHSPIVEPFTPDLENAVSDIIIKNPVIPIYSSLRGGKPLYNDFGAKYWAEHISQPVRFAETIKVMLSDGYKTFIEISPHGVLSGAIDECANKFNADVRQNLPVTAISTLKRFTDSNIALTDCLALLANSELLDLKCLPNDIQISVIKRVAEIAQAKETSKLPTENNLTPNRLNSLIREAIKVVTQGIITPPSDNNVGFLEMGLTSQHAVRMASYLSKELGFHISATLMFDKPNIASLTHFLNNEYSKKDNLNTKSIDNIDINEIDTKTHKIYDKKIEIAIIGMACRFPGSANTPAKFHKLLLDGRCVIQPVPSSRWNSKFWLDLNPDILGKAYSQVGGFLDDSNIFDLDAQFFRISPKEALSLDPQQRLLLETIWETFENAATLPSSYSGERVGVYVGLSTIDYMGSHLWSPNPQLIDGYSATGSMYSAAAGRISYLLNLQGPNFPVDTACSSSLTALDCACQALRSGVISSAIVAGVNVMVHPHLFVYFSKLGALSASGRCRTFDALADGYVRGEGAGAILLKPLDKAIADNDRILAVIKGTAVNHDGASSSFTAPNGTAQQKVIRLALENAGISHLDVDYVEAHGTGTRLGDPIEMQALGAVYGEDRPKDRPLWVGSVKANIGHLEAAAGMASIIKTILTLNSGIIPPQVGFETPNPLISWNDLPIEIPREKIIFQDIKKSGNITGTNNKRFIAGISAFGFSGTNAHVIIAQPPKSISNILFKNLNLSPSTPNNSYQYNLTISAKTQESLIAYCRDYIEFIKQIDDSPDNNAKHLHKKLIDMCYTAQVGRTEFDYKCFVSGNSKSELIANIEKFISNADSTHINNADSFSTILTGNKISIPTYPFQRKRFWMNPVATEKLSKSDYVKPVYARLDAESSGEVESETYKRNISIFPGQKIFLPPISQNIISKAEEIVSPNSKIHNIDQDIEVYNIEVDEKSPSFISEHIIYGEPIVPAAAYLSYLFSYFARGNRANSVAIDIRFTAPMVVHELRSVQLVCENSDQPNLDDSGTAFKIISRTVNESWITHCEGRLESSDKGYNASKQNKNSLNRKEQNSARVKDQDSSSWKDRYSDKPFTAWIEDFCNNSTQTIAGSEFYSNFQQLGYNLGTGFCRIEQAHSCSKQTEIISDLWRTYFDSALEDSNSGKAVCHFDLTPESVTQGYDIYPGFIDAMLQSLVFGKPEIIETMKTESKILIPFALESFEAYELQIPEKVVSIVSTRLESDYIQGDIRVFTTDGVPILSFLGLTVKLTDRSTLLKNLKYDSKNSLNGVTQNLNELQNFYNIYWEESEVPLNKPINIDTQSQKILIFSDQVGIGNKICEKFESIGLTPHIILKEDFHSKLPSLTKNTPNELLKIIYLYGSELKFDQNEPISIIQKRVVDALYYAQLLLKFFAESGDQFKFYGITCNAFSIDQKSSIAEKASNAIQQIVWGFCKTVALEYPEYFGGIVDFSENSALYQIELEHFISDFISNDNLDMRLYRASVTDLSEVQVKLFYPRIKNNMVDSPHIAANISNSQTSSQRLDLNGAYLITGASGGLGLPIAQKLVELGARKLWLLIRREPDSEFLEALQELKKLTNKNLALVEEPIENKEIEIKLIQVDICDFEKLNGELKRLSCDLSTLKGVIHLAGVRQDALLPLQTYQSLSSVIEPKAVGAWNLHTLVKDLQLDFFILFSSAASFLGSQGQSNYSAANAFLDGLADYRRSLGLPALSIQWGPWSESGMAAEESVVRENLTNLGFSYISQEQGLKILESLIGESGSQIGVFECDWSAYLDRTGQHKASLFKNLIPKIDKSVDIKISKTPIAPLWQELNKLSGDQRHRLLLRNLATLAQEVSGFNTTFDRPLMEQGFDSLMAVEFRNQLQKMCGFSLPVTLLFTYPGLEEIANFLEKRHASDKAVNIESNSKIKQDSKNLEDKTNVAKSDNSKDLQENQLEELEVSNIEISIDDDFQYLDSLTSEELNELIANDLKDI